MKILKIEKIDSFFQSLGFVDRRERELQLGKPLSIIDQIAENIEEPLNNTSVIN